MLTFWLFTVLITILINAALNSQFSRVEQLTNQWHHLGVKVHNRLPVPLHTVHISNPVYYHSSLSQTIAVSQCHYILTLWVAIGWLWLRGKAGHPLIHICMLNCECWHTVQSTLRDWKTWKVLYKCSSFTICHLLNWVLTLEIDKESVLKNG